MPPRNPTTGPNMYHRSAVVAMTNRIRQNFCFWAWRYASLRSSSCSRSSGVIRLGIICEFVVVVRSHVTKRWKQTKSRKIIENFSLVG
jgi:hypothetical protein